MRTRANTAEQTATAQAAIRANINAAVESGEAVIAGIETASSLVQKELAGVAQARTEAIKKMFGARSVKAALDIQVKLAKTEQDRANAFVGAMTKLSRSVTDAALKPVQAQLAQNLKALNRT